MNTLKKAYYAFMYGVTDGIMWLCVDNRDHWAYWWYKSEDYRKKRDAV